MSDVPFRPAPLMRALVDAGVEFVVIGGLAVAVHGYERFTADLDLVPNPDAANLRRLEAVLAELAEADETDAGRSLDAPHAVVETRFGLAHVIRAVKGLPSYADLERDAIEVEFADAVSVAVCGREDLIEMKRASGRPRDALDVAYLTESQDE